MEICPKLNVSVLLLAVTPASAYAGEDFQFKASLGNVARPCLNMHACNSTKHGPTTRQMSNEERAKDFLHLVLIFYPIWTSILSI